MLEVDAFDRLEEADRLVATQRFDEAARLPLDEGNLAAAGVRGIGMGMRAFIVGIPLVAVTVADSRVGVAAAILYAAAYTLELAVSLVTFFGAEAKRA